MTRPSIFLALSLQACSANNSETTTAPPQDTELPPKDGDTADVTAVTATGSEGAYTFAVTLASPDTGCDQYANWWEVLDEEGNLLYRRILGHSHVGEQPFTRTGGPVDVAADQQVYVRAHMDPAGYGGEVFAGSVADGFQSAADFPEFDAAVETQAPQPDGCAF